MELELHAVLYNENVQPILFRKRRTTRASFTEDYFLFQKEIEDLCAAEETQVFPFVSLKFIHTREQSHHEAIGLDGRQGYDGMFTETIMTLPQKKQD